MLQNQFSVTDLPWQLSHHMYFDLTTICRDQEGNNAILVAESFVLFLLEFASFPFCQDLKKTSKKRKNKVTEKPFTISSGADL